MPLFSKFQHMEHNDTTLCTHLSDLSLPWHLLMTQKMTQSLWHKLLWCTICCLKFEFHSCASSIYEITNCKMIAGIILEINFIRYPCIRIQICRCFDAVMFISYGEMIHCTFETLSRGIPVFFLDKKTRRSSFAVSVLTRRTTCSPHASRTHAILMQPCDSPTFPCWHLQVVTFAPKRPPPAGNAFGVASAWNSHRQVDWLGRNILRSFLVPLGGEHVQRQDRWLDSVKRNVIINESAFFGPRINEQAGPKGILTFCSRWFQCLVCGSEPENKAIAVTKICLRG